MPVIRVYTADNDVHVKVIVAEAKRLGFSFTFTPVAVEIEVPTVDGIFLLGIAVGKRLKRQRAKRTTRS